LIREKQNFVIASRESGVAIQKNFHWIASSATASSQ
jgi:hypothetical protein